MAKILYVADAAIPSRAANSIQVMKMCQALSQTGHEVTLISPRWLAQSDLPPIDLWRHYGIRTPFPIRRLLWPGKRGGHFYALQIVLYARCSNWDVIYSRHLSTAALAAKIGLPVVCEFHGIPHGVTSDFYLRMLAQGWGLKVVVMITCGLRTDFAKAFPRLLDGKQVVIAPDGVDLDQFNEAGDSSWLRQKLGLGVRVPIAGYAGHLYPGKGIEVILALAHRCPDVYFLILGGEPAAVAKRRAQVQQAGSKNICFSGFIPNAELPPYLAACDVLLLPNQRYVEGVGGDDIARWTSPLKLFEYMAAGRLIVSSDTPALREILNESNACLCDPEDLGQWQRALTRAAEDVSWREAIGRQSRRDASRYTWLKRVERCLSPVLSAAKCDDAHG